MISDVVVVTPTFFLNFFGVMPVDETIPDDQTGRRYMYAEFGKDFEWLLIVEFPHGRHTRREKRFLCGSTTTLTKSVFRWEFCAGKKPDRCFHASDLISLVANVISPQIGPITFVAVSNLLNLISYNDIT